MSTQAVISAIAVACNTADEIVSRAPFKELAVILIGSQDFEINDTMYLLMNSCATSGAWHRAKDNVTKALGSKNFVWESSGPNYRTRDTKKLPFSIQSKEDAKLAKKRLEEAHEAEQAKLQAAAAAQRQYEQEVRDRETTVDDLVSVLLADCERLGLSASEALAKLTLAIASAEASA